MSRSRDKEGHPSRKFIAPEGEELKNSPERLFQLTAISHGITVNHRARKRACKLRSTP